MACEICKPFMKYSDQHVTFEDFEKLFHITKLDAYNMCCHGEAECKACKHHIEFSHEEILLVKLYVSKW